MLAARAADVINNKFLLDATFRGHYGEDTLAIAERLAAIAGGTLDIRDEAQGITTFRIIIP